VDELTGGDMEFSHLDEKGAVRMVDITGKKIVHREARACGTVFLAKETIEMIEKNLIKKGDVLAVAKIAAIGGAKKTSELIPLCHPIPINAISIDFLVKKDRINITSTAICDYKTGIEMEALTAVAIAALTIVDMCKAVDKNIMVSDIKLEKKTKNEI
jgi:cyclic pyranopterin phosphate synthase